MNIHPSSSLPDTQNSGKEAILGAPVAIQQVGMSNFRLPLKIKDANGKNITVEASITGTVGLQENAKGVNMSRIMRIFYRFADDSFTLEKLQEVLLTYKKEIGTHSARLKLTFNYPLKLQSLRSELEGFQYYTVSYEGKLNAEDHFQKFIHFDFVYSSACPASSELAEHARETRSIYAIPHSQRSKARISIQVKDDAVLSIEEIQQMCQKALTTETQVMVRRVDEQAFAELNGAQTKFVEDAARLLYCVLNEHSAIYDFQAVCAHLESLHSHDAVSVVAKGLPGGFTGEFEDFRNLIC